MRKSVVGTTEKSGFVLVVDIVVEFVVYFMDSLDAVSYTHLDVYKRQHICTPASISPNVILKYAFKVI